MSQPVIAGKSSTRIIKSVLAAEFGVAMPPLPGVFTDLPAAATGFPAAQQAFIDALTGALAGAEPDRGRTLLAGEALAPVARVLATMGHDVTWLCGDPGNDCVSSDVASTAAIPITVKPGALLTAGDLGTFSRILVAGTVHYLDQLPLLNRCRELLQPAGELFLCGEFLRDDSAIAWSSLPNLSSHQQLAERLGYRCVRSHDHDRDVLHTVILFLGMMQRHAATVRENLEMSQQEWDAWQCTFELMLAELETGRRSYRFWHWRLPDPAQDPAYATQLGEYARAEFGDIHTFAPPEISYLFQRSFDKPFNAALWRWKYELGDGKCVVARIEPGGEIVAHYGGAPRKIRYFDHPTFAIQVCDVMVLPEKRRQYGKSSLFFKTAATFLEREIGNTVNHLLGFGFPNQSAMNIATRLGLYKKTDDFMEVVFPPASDAASTVKAVDLAIADPAHRAQVDRLWQLMSMDFREAIIGLRDAAYIQYRYFAHPGAETGQFHCQLLTHGAEPEPFALVVLKQHGDSQLLLDMVCPVARMPEAITSTNQLLNAHSPNVELRLWLTQGWLHVLPLEGAAVNDLSIDIPCNSWNPGPDATVLYGKWWLTAGDMDFM